MLPNCDHLRIPYQINARRGEVGENQQSFHGAVAGDWHMIIKEAKREYRLSFTFSLFLSVISIVDEVVILFGCEF